MKNMLYRILSLAMCILMCIAVAGCNQKAEETQAPTEFPTEAPTETEKKTEAPKKMLSYNKSLITLKTPVGIRDPFVLRHEGKIYVYGTGWFFCKTNFDNTKATFSDPVYCVVQPSDCVSDCWAPEVYSYNGKFYMFTTYRSSKNNHRGCAVFAADSPEGPFKIVSDGHVTPSDWDAIDGTLYIDKEGQPWMVFVHEWTSMADGIGSFACAKLSEDLTHFISEPVELFKANDAPWCRSGVTDGCFMYTTESGKLLMIWSSFDEYGYCVSVAVSESGNVSGPWVQEKKPLFTKSITNEYDGGHGMIFTDKNGNMWISIHSPNSKTDLRVEMPVLIPIVEKDDMLVWDRYERK